MKFRKIFKIFCLLKAHSRFHTKDLIRTHLRIWAFDNFKVKIIIKSDPCTLLESKKNFIYTFIRPFHLT